MATGVLVQDYPPNIILLKYPSRFRYSTYKEQHPTTQGEMLSQGAEGIPWCRGLCFGFHRLGSATHGAVTWGTTSRPWSGWNQVVGGGGKIFRKWKKGNIFLGGKMMMMLFQTMGDEELINWIFLVFLARKFWGVEIYMGVSKNGGTQQPGVSY